jgi:hypothetical protein
LAPHFPLDLPTKNNKQQENIKFRTYHGALTIQGPHHRRQCRGLSLALMLEKNEIDFLILEAYPEIAPQIGASIGLWPNGLRVLDQLGCYEDLLKLAENSINTTSEGLMESQCRQLKG